MSTTHTSPSDHVLSICANQIEYILEQHRLCSENGSKANRINKKYILAALLIKKGYCKKKNGKPNYTAAAKAAGAVLNKNLKGVKDWIQKINELPLNILMLNES